MIIILQKRQKMGTFAGFQNIDGKIGHRGNITGEYEEEEEEEEENHFILILFDFSR